MTSRRSEPRAAYLILADELREAIRRGEYDGNRQLPTEASLARRHGLSRQTVRRAYLELVIEELVERIPGRGTFPTGGGRAAHGKYLRQFGSVEDLMYLDLDTTVEIVRPLTHGINVEAAARLALNTDLVHSLSYRRLHRRKAFGWTTVNLPEHVAALLGDVDELATPGSQTALTVIGLLEPRLGSPISEVEQTISAVAADTQHAEALGCTPGAPLLRIDRLFVSSEDEPVELSVGYYLPEQYTYRTTLRRASGRA